ncbi:RAS guanyl-releasing protein 1-like [Protopterus annectens]|uniref:RAS guanyl-releasing protein 1-like n=1 Tax=Protopterus annectens TaxID=7888 RepID=UPI001CFA4C2E|nr:RAS guanyl-releasing protein 1-like [Protopterus annectens]
MKGHPPPPPPRIVRRKAMGYKRRESCDANSGGVTMGTAETRAEEQQNFSPRCNTDINSALIMRQAIPHVTSPKPAHNNPIKTMMPLGQLAKGATLEQVIDTCIESFDLKGNVCGNSHLLQVTLTMHRLITTSTELLEKLISLYPFTFFSPTWSKQVNLWHMHSSS